MNTKVLKYILLFFFFVPPVLSGQHYLTSKYDLDSGLPSTSTYDITQDSQGCMWFATRNGITSYDGVNWKTFQPVNSPMNRDFSHIEVDSQGTVWTATKILEDGIFYLKNDTLRQIKGPRPLSSKKDSFSRITGLSLVYSKDNLQIALGTYFNGLYIREADKWVNYTTKNSPIGKRIIAIKSDGRNLYILCERGLAVYRDGRFSYQLQQTYNLHAGQIYDISLEWSSKVPFKKHFVKRIWLLAADWIGYIERNALYTFKHHVHFNSPFNSSEYHRYNSVPDGHRGLLFSNEEALFHMDAEGEIEAIISKSGLAGEATLFRDMEQNIWIGNARGIVKISSFRFKNYTVEDGLLENEVTAITAWKDDVVAIGHNSGITLKKKDKYDYIKIHSKNAYLSLSRVMDMAVDKYNRLWIADLYNGVARIQPWKKIKWYKFGNLKVNTLLAKSNNEIWVGTTAGLYRVMNNRVELVQEETIPNVSIRKIIKVSDGSILVATINNGLFVYRNGEWTNYSSNENNEFNNVYCGYLVQNDKLLIGSRAGLCVVDSDSLVAYDKGFKIDRPVYFIHQDKKDRLWFGTDNGVFIWDGKKLKHLNKQNGLAGNELNRAAFYEDPKGMIWLGTAEGLSVYNEKYDHSDGVKPRLWLTSVQIDGRHFDPGEAIKLNHSENDLAFNFQFTSFRDEKRVLIRYKLEGFDEEWRIKQKLTSTSIRYFNLPPGEYRFMIQLESVDYIFSPVVMSEYIKILLPYWESWWFYLIVLAVIIFFFYYITSYYSRLQYAKRLEKQIDLRTRQLRLSEMKYRSIFENSQDAVIVSQPDGYILDANPAALDMFGYESKEEFLKINIPKHLYADEKDREKFLVEMEKSGFVQDMELRLKRKDGSTLVTLLSSVCHNDSESGTKQYLSILKDVTQRWQLKEQLAQAQRMESIGMLAGGIAHDFNNILGGILGYASLIKLQISEGDRFYRFVDSIEKSAVRGAELTNQLLVFAKRGQAQLSRVQINDVVNDTLKIIRSTFPKSIKIDINLSESIPPVLSDEAQLNQVLMNLCVNARDAIAEKGTVTINTKSLTIDQELAKQYNVSREGTYVVIEVADTGIGIEPNLLKHIFEPFFSTKEQGKGTGLGLSMIYGFVHSQNGFIDVESTPGKGSIFRIFLPAIPAETDRADSKGELRSQLQKGDEVILVVDDEKVLRDFLHQALEGYGYTVLEAEDGEKAIKIFKENSEKVQLIILDMIMPNMGGEKALYQIRQMNSTVPVLVSSGYSDKDKFEQIAALGIAGILHKPFRINKLLTQIRTILDN